MTSFTSGAWPCVVQSVQSGVDSWPTVANADVAERDDTGRYSGPALQDASAFSFEKSFQPFCVLGKSDETSDVILEVEGRELHANRAVLAHYSPVFRKMFFSDFKEKSETKVPLPGKKYHDMVKFFNVLYPQSHTFPGLIADEDLATLLTLADEYQADQVKARCQDHIGEQLYEHYRNGRLKTPKAAASSAPAVYSMGPGMMFALGPEAASKSSPSSSPRASPWVNQLTLYLVMCDRYDLPRHRPDVKALLMEQTGCLDDVSTGTHYSSLPLLSRVELLESLCRKLDGSENRVVPPSPPSPDPTLMAFGQCSAITRRGRRN